MCERSPRLTSDQSHHSLSRRTRRAWPAGETTAWSGSGIPRRHAPCKPRCSPEVSPWSPSDRGRSCSVSMAARNCRIASRSHLTALRLQPGVAMARPRSGIRRLEPSGGGCRIEGRPIATCFISRTATVWQRRSPVGLCRCTIRSGEAGLIVFSDPGQAERPAWSLALSPDERFIVAAIGVQGEAGTAAIWDVCTGQLRTVLRGHSDYVRAVAFSHDGQILATGSGDETIKLWDFATGVRARDAGGPSRSGILPRFPVEWGTLRFWLGRPHHPALGPQAPAPSGDSGRACRGGSFGRVFSRRSTFGLGQPRRRYLPLGRHDPAQGRQLARPYRASQSGEVLARRQDARLGQRGWNDSLLVHGSRAALNCYSVPRPKRDRLAPPRQAWPRSGGHAERTAAGSLRIPVGGCQRSSARSPGLDVYAVGTPRATRGTSGTQADRRGDRSPVGMSRNPPWLRFTA